MDAQYERLTMMEFLRPADDEFLGIVVEVFFLKRRRVHRIEELLDPIDVNLDRPLLRRFSSKVQALDHELIRRREHVVFASL